MARIPKGWERLLPSRGKDGTPGRRLVSHDDQVQVQIYRQKHGPHAGWRWLWEWNEDREEWEFLVRDSRSNIVAQVFGPTVADATEAANQTLDTKGYDPLPI